MKALLLAAGFGTRLKPLTDHVPKPLTLFMGRPILDLVYGQVLAAGIDQVAVNTHHLAQKIESHIQKSPLYKQPVRISFETEILGTGGSINPLRPWLDGDDLLIFNGDIITSLDLKSFVARYRESQAIASMVLLPHKDGTTPVYVQNDRIVSIGEAVPGATKKTFAGVHILSNRFVEAVPRSGFLSVIDTYKALLKDHLVLAFEHDGYWADLGIPRDYLEAHQSLLGDPGRATLCKAIGLDTSNWIWDEAKANLFVGTKQLPGFEKSFVFGPVEVEAGIHIQNCIVYPGTKLTKLSHEAGKILSSYASLNIV
ncbi:MAG: NTP transferase domain-containing protein [Oligoflexus sp.]|nr:NTP transferase domain-containing protein [Oligoflexus sp.]